VSPAPTAFGYATLFFTFAARQRTQQACSCVVRKVHSGCKGLAVLFCRSGRWSGFQCLYKRMLAVQCSTRSPCYRYVAETFYNLVCNQQTMMSILWSLRPARVERSNRWRGFEFNNRTGQMKKLCRPGMRYTYSVHYTRGLTESQSAGGDGRYLLVVARETMQ
jgi:hypothetical protein